ncbi:MAG TPA: site-specific integrase [Spirochaetota bacterium]|nr:site-specific integrase [Spirochaetota bacterium]HRZ28341.1 site-specific integrase [Spirochaetota bacterium]HSA15265.1 site-specific integrase [Spirochaetota bacterium]
MPFKKDPCQNRVPLGNIKYQFDMVYKGKRIRKRVVCRRSEVERQYSRWLEEVIEEHDAENPKIFSLFKRYLDVFSRVMKSKKQYAAEIAFYEQRFTKFFDNVKIRDFRRTHIESYIAWRFDNEGKNGKATRSTVNKDINILSSFMNWAIRNELYIRGNPCKGLKVNEKNIRHIRLTGDEIVEIITKASFHPGLLTVVMIGIFAGLRKSEMTGLKWTDIDFETRRIDVRAETAKGKKGRSVPIPDPLYDYLIQLPHTRVKVTISEATIKRHMDELRDSLSFIDRMPGGTLRLHDLRHIYAQSMRDAGVSIDDLQAFLGHSSPIVTHMRYAQAGGFDGVTKVNRIKNIIDVTVNVPKGKNVSQH